MFARPFIDSLEFAVNGSETSGEVPVTELPRLADILENTDGILNYAVRGSMDEQDNPVLDVNIAGNCRLCCQRCLEGMDYPVRIDARLMLRSQAELDVLRDDEEEFDSILAEKHLDVLNLLEEEILLSLPIAPRHEAGACQTAGGETADKEASHPFGVLAKLKAVK